MLRWHGRVRTVNGHIDSYVRVKARSAIQAAQRSQRKAYEEHKVEFPQYTLDDWRVIGVSLHVKDHNRLREA